MEIRIETFAQRLIVCKSSKNDFHDNSAVWPDLLVSITEIANHERSKTIEESLLVGLNVAVVTH